MPNSATPVPKVAAAGISGSLAVVIIFIATQSGVDMSAEVGAAIAALVSFGAGYVKK
ncbi:MAG: hypothetical protein H0U53_02105 [Actinobacteria bacterium]|nr:hypothetical protein [Actinomycetota bacterium]